MWLVLIATLILFRKSSKYKTYNKRKSSLVHFSSSPAFIHCFHISNLCQNKCLNNGTCIINAEDKRESCLCSSAFSGDRCQINVDECSSSPCLHGGLCIDGLGEFICSCPEGMRLDSFFFFFICIIHSF